MLNFSFQTLIKCLPHINRLKELQAIFLQQHNPPALLTNRIMSQLSAEVKAAIYTYIAYKTNLNQEVKQNEELGMTLWDDVSQTMNNPYCYRLGNKTRRQRLVEVGVRQLHDETLLLYIDYI